MKNKHRIEKLETQNKLLWDYVDELHNQIVEIEKNTFFTPDGEKPLQQVSHVEIDSLREEINDRINELTEKEMNINSVISQLSELDAELYDDSEYLTRERFYDIVNSLANIKG